MTILKTFKVHDVKSAIMQCELQLIDLGFSTSVVQKSNHIIVHTNEQSHNYETGKTSQIGFKLIPYK